MTCKMMGGGEHEGKPAKGTKKDVRGEGGMEGRNFWNAFACCLPPIKGEYGRNATLKRLNKQGGRVLGVCMGRSKECGASREVEQD